MEEEVSPQPIKTIDLDEEYSLREVNLTLTVGQIELITALIEQNVQPRGYEMVKLVYELFERLQIPEIFADSTEQTSLEAFD
jgi:hypothetical protein